MFILLFLFGAFLMTMAHAATLGIAGDIPALPVIPAVQETIQLPYDVIFVMSNRPGGATGRSLVPEVDDPTDLESGSHLYLLKAGTTDPEILVDAGEGGILDPFVGFDAKHIFFSWCGNMKQLNAQRGNLPLSGCDIYVMEIATKQLTLLVGQHNVWKPRGSAGVTWSANPLTAEPPGTTYLGYGIVNKSPVPLWNGDLWFVSNLAGFDIIRGFTNVSLQAYILHADTGEIEQMWSPPTTVMDAIPLSHTGEIVFATLENHLFGKEQRWGIWAARPTGEEWRPLYSATMDEQTVRHNCTEFRGSLWCGAYYFSNNNAMGTVVSRPLFYGGTPSAPEFGPERVLANPRIPEGTRFAQHAYTPAGMMNVLPSHQFDEASHKGPDGEWIGKGGFPWATSTGVLLSYSDGAANYAARPIAEAPHLYLAFMPNGDPVSHKNQLNVVYRHPTKNIFLARSVEPYKAIYGVDHPKALPTRPLNDGTIDPRLPKGTPYAMIGSSTVRKPNRESCGGQWYPGFECARPFYTLGSPVQSNLAWQGSDTVKFADDQIVAVQFIAQEGVPHYSHGPGSSSAASRTFYAAHGNERLAKMVEIPLIKRDKVTGAILLDPQGNPDTSFLAMLPANVSFTFRLVRQDGATLVHVPTWRQLRPGEKRTNCGGCHAHNKEPLDFASTAAGQPGFKPRRITGQGLTSPEWHADVLPILTKACATCHNATLASGGLDVVTATPIQVAGIGHLPRNYMALAKDPAGKYSVKPMEPFARRSSRFADAHRAADSLLVWVMQHKRGDYLTNEARPTETTVGDASTLPAGVDMRLADIDLTAAVLKAHQRVRVSRADVQTVVEFIDNGFPIDLQADTGWKREAWLPTIGWYADDNESIVGIADVGSGLASLTVSRDGLDVTSQLTPLPGERFRLPHVPGRYTVVAKDHAGNEQRIVRIVP